MGVRLGVAVAVTVGVGGVPLAEPFNLIEAFAAPRLASLAIKIESWNFPSMRGANCTVTTNGAPFGGRVAWPPPSMIVNCDVTGDPRVTLSVLVPTFLTEKVLDWLIAVLPKVTTLNPREPGAIFILLNGVGVFLASGTTFCAATGMTALIDRTMLSTIDQ